ncbi:hypothetical protein CXB51_003894 [Gossypium anomalum]|uniref:Pectin lyase-like superfamily protein n=1 Tax=Gossypium anomalum TaxID=47600 RepID=A0A8J5ZH17_9ROSI|nr:hypothetical protein CXB51_003894 [Gossypium anomalum]
MVYFTKPSWAFLVLLFTVIAQSLVFKSLSKAIIFLSFHSFPFLDHPNSTSNPISTPGSCAAIFGNFTLFLEQGAVILGSQDPEEWPIVEPLPSYGRGRERMGRRHISLIHGDGLTNVVITGNNGTIDGQGRIWWELWWNRTLNTTQRPPRRTDELSNVVVKGMTILAPLNAPNTDGIDPVYSSTNVCIEDCYIESGDDLVAIKKWMGPVRHQNGTTKQNKSEENLRHYTNLFSWGPYKTDKGRGGYIANITIRNIMIERVKIPIRLSRGSNDHPDDRWDPKAIPKLRGIFVSNIVSLNSTKAPVLAGIRGASFEGLCFKNLLYLGFPRTRHGTNNGPQHVAHRLKFEVSSFLTAYGNFTSTHSHGCSEQTGF